MPINSSTDAVTSIRLSKYQLHISSTLLYWVAVQRINYISLLLCYVGQQYRDMYQLHISSTFLCWVAVQRYVSVTYLFYFAMLGSSTDINISFISLLLCHVGQQYRNIWSSVCSLLCMLLSTENIKKYGGFLIKCLTLLISIFTRNSQNIFYHNVTAMTSSYLLLRFVFTVILGVNLCKIKIYSEQALVQTNIDSVVSAVRQLRYCMSVALSQSCSYQFNLASQVWFCYIEYTLICTV